MIWLFLKFSPYVEHMGNVWGTCGDRTGSPYVPYMFPIGFDCSSAMRLLSALFCPATAALAVCLGKTFLELKVDGMDQAKAYRQIHSTVRPRDGVRACKNTVRCPDDCPFQVSSSWRSRGWVQEEDSNPFDTQRLFKGLSGMRRVFAGFCKFQVVVDAAVSLWSVNWDLQRYTGRQTV